jgi:hypothetical protein
MIFGMLAICCWLLLVVAILAVPIMAFKKKMRILAVLSVFVLGGLLASALVWRTTRPELLSFRESLKAGLTDAGLREYGHPIEHQAEVAICLSSYAWVLGGGMLAGVTLASLRMMAGRKPV